MSDADIALLNKVELRFAVTKNEEKFSSLLNSLLPPLLLKLASPHANVREKVVEICQHINLRIKSSYVFCLSCHLFFMESRKGFSNC